MTLVKICGITSVDDALAAVELGADALGFNFYRKSPRYVDPEKAREIMEDIPPAIWRVGVFVNEAEDIVRDLTVALSLDYLQFHGDETPYYCEQFSAPFWKAFRLKDEKSLELMKKYKCEYYLIDAYVKDEYGGTGKLADWKLAQEAKKMGKIFLAGGLTPENVAEAVRTLKPEGVDVASGVEQGAGKKDYNKVERFISHAKELDVA